MRNISGQMWEQLWRFIEFVGFASVFAEDTCAWNHTAFNNQTNQADTWTTGFEPQTHEGVEAWWLWDRVPFLSHCLCALQTKLSHSVGPGENWSIDRLGIWSSLVIFSHTEVTPVCLCVLSLVPRFHQNKQGVALLIWSLLRVIHEVTFVIRHWFKMKVAALWGNYFQLFQRTLYIFDICNTIGFLDKATLSSWWISMFYTLHETVYTLKIHYLGRRKSLGRYKWH